MRANTLAGDAVRTLAACRDDPLTMHRPSAEQLPASLRSGWHVVDTLLADPLLASANVRVNTASGPVNSRTYLKYHDGPTGAKLEYVDRSAVVDLFAAGATVIVDGVHTLLPDIDEVASGLALSTDSKSVDAVVFATPTARPGLPAHTDAVDVLVVQVAGTKTWTVWPSDGRREARTLSEDESGRPAERTFTVEPGECFYLPAGTPHRAETPLRTGSVHVSFTLTAYSVRDLVHHALDDAAGVLGLDLDAPAPRSRSELVPTVVHLAATVTAQSFDGVGRDDHAPSVLNYVRIEPGSKLEARNVPVRPSRSGDTTKVELVGTRSTVLLPRATVDSISILHGGSAVAAEDLVPGRPGAANLALSLALLRAGVLTTAKEGT